MKVNKIVTDVDNGQCYVAEVVFGSGDKINGVKVDDLLQFSITLELDRRTKVVSYKANAVGVVSANTHYIPAQTTLFTPSQLFREGWIVIMERKDFKHWQPTMQEDIEKYIADETKGKKSFSMKGDLNKAVFVVAYLYYLNAIPNALESRHDAITKKLNMSSGQFAKNLSRVSVDYADCSKYAQKNKVNLFKDIDKMNIKDKDVYLMRHTEKQLLGGYLSTYARNLIEQEFSKKFHDMGIDYTMSLDEMHIHAFVSTGKK